MPTLWLHRHRPYTGVRLLAIWTALIVGSWALVLWGLYTVAALFVGVWPW